MKNIRATYRIRKRMFMTILGIVSLFHGCEIEDFTSDSDDPRDSITDTWKCSEQGSLKSLKAVYYVTITKHPLDKKMVILDNFYNLGEGVEVYARMNDLDLSFSNYEAEGGFVFTGNGQISSKYDEIRWQYKVDWGTGDTDNVKATFTRL